MITCQKDKFSIPDHITYLNCSYMSPLPNAVESAGSQGLTAKKHPWEILPNDFFAPVEEVKKLFAKLINADEPNRIAILPSVSYGIANVVKNLSPTPQQNVVMLQEQFPSNVYAWQRLAEETGCSLQIVEAPTILTDRGSAWNDAILKRINSSTVAVALPHTHWADGTKFDLEAIRKRANEVGAMLIIDGTQSVGAMPFDVQKIQPDALICGGYKWLLGPYAFALGYYSEKFDQATPIEENWANRFDSENFQNLVNYQPLYKAGANRFCVGENSHFIAIPMMKAALSLLLDWKPENIQEYCAHISADAINLLREKGCWVEQPPFRGRHLIGVRLPKGTDLELLKNKVGKANIFVSFRGNAMRVSPHLFNTADDLNKLADLV